MEENNEQKCPNEVKEVVLDILYLALISIRMAGRHGNSMYCGLEADHIHNLPGLLKNYKVEKLRYYVNIEYPCYIESLTKLQGENGKPFETHLERLRKYI